MIDSPAHNPPLLDRRAAAVYLTALGCPIAAKTLANMAANSNAGGGPAFFRSGWRTVRYTRDALDAWACIRIVRVD